MTTSKPVNNCATSVQRGFTHKELWFNIINGISGIQCVYSIVKILNMFHLGVEFQISSMSDIFENTSFDISQPCHVSVFLVDVPCLTFWLSIIIHHALRDLVDFDGLEIDNARKWPRKTFDLSLDLDGYITERLPNFDQYHFLLKIHFKITLSVITLTSKIVVVISMYIELRCKPH